MKKQQEIENLNISNQNDIEQLIQLLNMKVIILGFQHYLDLELDKKTKGNVMGAQIPSEIIFNTIKNIINDPSEEIRSEVLSVLGDWKRKEDIKFICENLSNSSEQVRLDALYALGDINDDKVLVI